MNILFVCTANQDRSLTAEKIFKNAGLKHIRSAGTHPSARVHVTESLVQWADVVYAMEMQHVKFMRDSFHESTKDKRIECLHIPDTYPFMSPDLIELLHASLRVVNGGLELIV